MIEYPSVGHFAFVGDTPVLFEPGPSSLRVWHSHNVESSIPYDHKDYYDLLEWNMNQAAQRMREARRELMKMLSSLIAHRWERDNDLLGQWAKLGIAAGIGPRQEYREEVLYEWREAMDVVQGRLEDLGYVWLRHQRRYVAEPLITYLRNNDVIIENPLSVFDMIVTSIQRTTNNDKDTP